MYSDWVIPQAAMPSAVAVKLEPGCLESQGQRAQYPILSPPRTQPFAIYLIQDPSSSCTKHQFTTTLNPFQISLLSQTQQRHYSWRPPCLQQTLIHPTSRTRSPLCCLTSYGRLRRAGCAGEAPSPLHIEPEASSRRRRTSPAIRGSPAQTIGEIDNNRPLRSL